jgi:hypothetical protein
VLNNFHPANQEEMKSHNRKNHAESSHKKFNNVKKREKGGEFDHKNKNVTRKN